MTHICVSKLTILGFDNGLSPGRRQAIIWTNAGILLIGPLRTNFSEMLIGIHTFSFKKMHLKMSSGKWRPFCLGLNVLRVCVRKAFRFGVAEIGAALSINLICFAYILCYTLPVAMTSRQSKPYLDPDRHISTSYAYIQHAVFLLFLDLSI